MLLMIVVMTETGGFAEMMCGESDCQRVRAKVRAQARAEVRVRVVVQLEMQVGVFLSGFPTAPKPLNYLPSPSILPRIISPISTD